MTRGTTPTHTYTLPFDVPEGAKIRIVYAQNKRVIVEHTTEACAVDGARVVTRLSAEETLRFDCREHYHAGKYQPYTVEIQIGIATAHGDRLWSKIIQETPERCIKEDGVI